MAIVLCVLCFNEPMAGLSCAAAFFSKLFFLTLADAASFIFSIISVETASIACVTSIFGLAMTSTAPSSIASMVVTAPFCVRELRIMTGTG